MMASITSALLQPLPCPITLSQNAACYQCLTVRITTTATPNGSKYKSLKVKLYFMLSKPH